MPQRRVFQRFRRRGRPPWHLLAEDAVLVVNLPAGMQVDDDLFVPFGGVIPRDRFQERQLRALYDWRRIEVRSTQTPTTDTVVIPSSTMPPTPDLIQGQPPTLAGAAINSRGPVKAPVRREAHPAR